MITVFDAVKEFNTARHADGLKPATLRWYRHRLGSLAKSFGERDLCSLSGHDLRSYVVSLRTRHSRYADATQRPEKPGGLTEDTLNGHLRALRTFFRWCIREYELPTDWYPLARIRISRVIQTVPKAVDLHDFEVLLDQCDDSFMGKRNRAILLFMADSGCRAGGLIGLRLTDLDLNGGRALVTEKFNKSRVVCFTMYTARALTAWLEVRPERGDYLFCDRFGQPLKHSGLYQVLARLKKRAGLSGRVNPHAFRHMFAREYLNNGGDLASLSRLMGHTDTATTANYYAVFTERELQEKHHRFSPIQNFESKP